MNRISASKNTRKRHKKIIKLSKGFRGSISKLFKTTNQTIIKSLNYSYINRKKRKRDFKKLWIKRINIFCKTSKSTYNKLAKNLKLERIILNAKVKSQLCVLDKGVMEKLLQI